VEPLGEVDLLLGGQQRHRPMALRYCRTPSVLAVIRLDAGGATSPSSPRSSTTSSPRPGLRWPRRRATSAGPRPGRRGRGSPTAGRSPAPPLGSAGPSDLPTGDPLAGQTRTPAPRSTGLGARCSAPARNRTCCARRAPGPGPGARPPMGCGGRRAARQPSWWTSITTRCGSSRRSTTNGSLVVEPEEERVVPLEDGVLDELEDDPARRDRRDDRRPRPRAPPAGPAAASPCGSRPGGSRHPSTSTSSPEPWAVASA
jgi:hypothetical protein